MLRGAASFGVTIGSSANRRAEGVDRQFLRAREGVAADVVDQYLTRLRAVVDHSFVNFTFCYSSSLSFSIEVQTAHPRPSYAGARPKPSPQLAILERTFERVSSEAPHTVSRRELP